MIASDTSFVAAPTLGQPLVVGLDEHVGGGGVWIEFRRLASSGGDV